jgi:predicted nucleic acid-binding protein
MLVVLDSSVVAKWFLPEVLTDQALLLLDRWTSNNIEVIAPTFLFIEVSNIIWKKQRANQITPEEGEQMVVNLLNLNIPTVEGEPFLRRAYQMARHYDRTVYDSLYLAVAEGLDASFVSADQRLCNSVSINLAFVQYLGDYQP